MILLVETILPRWQTNFGKEVIAINVMPFWNRVNHGKEMDMRSILVVIQMIFHIPKCGLPDTFRGIQNVFFLLNGIV